MPRWIAIGAVVAFVVGVVLAARASRRLLVVRVRAGRIVSLRGRAPGDLVHDFEDLLARDRASGTVVIVIERGAARVEASGSIDASTRQRLRNVVGRFTLPRLRAAPRVR